MSKFERTLLFVFITFVFHLASGYSSNAFAQIISSWSPPQNIPGVADDTLPPFLIADTNQTVHAFFSQWLSLEKSQKAIFYSKWNPDTGWTSPVDVLLSPQNEARIQGAFLDKSRRIHVIFFGGDDTEANIYYSSAPLSEAGTARSWSEPVVIGPKAITPTSAALSGDGNGNMVVVYSSDLEGNGFYSVFSSDGGETWTDPELIYSTNDPNLWAYAIVMDPNLSGIVHTAWNVVDKAGQGRGIYFANLDLIKKQWTDPLQLAYTPTGLGSWWPAIKESNGQIYLAYILPPKIVMRTSTDGGNTWTNPAVLFPEHVGVNGTLSLVSDGNNTLHLLFGQRIPGSPDIHGMWHSALQGKIWSNPEAVISGPRVIDLKGNKGFDPYDARSVVSQGNVLLATWRTDPGDIKPNGVFYSYKKLDAVEAPITPLPILKSNSSTIITQTSEIENNPIAISQTLGNSSINIISTSTAGAETPSQIFLISLIPVILLLSIISVRYFFINQRQS